MTITCTVAGLAAVAAASPTTTTLTVFRGSTNLGQEVISVEPVGQGFKETTSTKVKWGSGIELTGSLVTGDNGSPLEAEETGKTLGWYTDLKKWSSGAAAAAGYPLVSPFPVSRQASLVRYWLRSGKPDQMRTTGGNEVSIRKCGQVTATIRLHCFELGGLVWGNSLVWLDRSHQVQAAYVPTVLGSLEYLSEKALPVRAQLARVAAQGAARLAKETAALASADKVPLVLRDANVIDVVGRAVLPGSTIVIADDRIRYVGRDKDAPIPANARIIDLHGKTVMPGLWEMHAHIRGSQWGPAYLGTGITTTRDLGNDLEFIREFRRIANDELSLSPHVLAAGMIDATPNSPYPDYDASTPEMGRQLVDRYSAAGFDHIKVWENVPKNSLQAIIDRAHQLGLKVTGHVPRSVSLREAVEMGQDQINHIGALTRALDPDRPGSFQSDDELAEFLLKHRVVVDPTLVVAEWRLHRQAEPLSVLEPNSNEVPIDLYGNSQGLRGKPLDIAQDEAFFGRILRLLKKLHTAGVPIVAGSDGGIPGYSLIHEIELYVEAGLTPMDALRTATIAPATAMGKADVVGAIAPGLRSDLLILDGDPSKNISALRRSCAVMKSGRLYYSRDLRAAAGFKVISAGCTL